MIAVILKTKLMGIKQLTECAKWCREQFGWVAFSRETVDDSHPWLCYYSEETKEYWWYFAREENASMFALRWL